MKTILVLARHPELAEAVRDALNPDQYRVTHRMDLEEAEPLLGAGVMDACIVDAELSQVQGLWTIEKLRERLPQCPLLVYTGAKQWEWEEEAYLQGVMHVLAKPLRRRVLNVLLDRLWAKPSTTSAMALARSTPAPPLPLEAFSPAEVSPATSQALRVLRNFSGVLTHSLRADALLKQFLL